MLSGLRKFFSGLVSDAVVTSYPSRGSMLRRAIHCPEQLEPRQLLAFVPAVGRDTNDPYMEPQKKVGDPPNPQWNMEYINAYPAWGIYTGNRASVAVVQDYGVDFRHEDFGATATTNGNLWDFGNIGAVNNNNSFTISRRGREDYTYPVHVPLPDVPADWNDKTLPKTGQYFGNITAGIIGAATNNTRGVAGINWNTQIYSAEVVIDDTTAHDFIAVRSNRVIQWLRAGLTNPNHQEIRVVSFGYSSERDYGNIFNEPHVRGSEPFTLEFAQDVADTVSTPPKRGSVDEGHYDFNSLGAGIASMPGRDATWGILVTVPVGDWNKTWPTRYYRPNSPDNVISVAAIDKNDRPWVGNADNPFDIWAPGVDIVSVTESGNSYAVQSGTRQAQAHVAGAVQLLYNAAELHSVVVDYREVRRAIIEGGRPGPQGKPILDVVGALRKLSEIKRVDLLREPVPNTASIAISGGAGMEGDSGSSSATFVVQLDKVLAVPTTVIVGIEDGTARRADRDFVLPSRGQVRVVIPAGQRQATFSVNVLGDTRVEGDETLTARIIALPKNITSGFGASATWTINNDDIGPSLSVVGASVSEGSTVRPGVASVLVKLDKPLSDPVTVQYSLVGGTAVAVSDFQPQVARVLTIPAGRTSAPILVRLVGNDTAGVDRTFQVRIDSVVNATLPSPVAARSATVLIIDDDRPFVTIRPGSVSASGSATTLVFFVQLSKPSTTPVTVAFSTRDGSGGRGAIAGSDYTALAGSVVFNPGERVKRIEVTVLPRRAGQRYPKDLFLDLTDASDNAALKTVSTGGSAVGRIS